MKTKLKITFPASLTNTPLTYRLIKEFNLKVNILKANIDYNHVGNILYEITGEEDQVDRTLTELRKSGLSCTMIDATIQVDEARCTDCGTCSAVCLTGALAIGEPDWSLSFSAGKCVGCNHCITVCPSKAIRIRDMI